MELEKVFKNIILLMVFIIVISFAQYYFFPNLSAPDPDYIMINDDKPYFIDIISSPLNYILGTILFAAFFAHLFSFYLLYKFKKSGKKFFIYSYVIILLISFFTSGNYYSGLTETVDWIVTALDGAVIVFLYFTPIKEKFN